MTRRGPWLQGANVGAVLEPALTSGGSKPPPYGWSSTPAAMLAKSTKYPSYSYREVIFS